MNTYIGVDLGTSAVKLLLADEGGKVLSSASESYPVFYPHAGWSEQNPNDWLAAVERAMPRLLHGFDGACVRGISFGGQMHGLVVLDEKDEVIRPCILWNDGRTQAQTDYLNDKVKGIVKFTANRAFAGFTAPKILWLEEHEPENFARISKIMLPKDYLIYKLTGAFVTDLSDASGTLLLDVENRNWSGDMLEICHVKREWLPELKESYEAVGELKPCYAEKWGLAKVKAAAGAGDNAAAATGTGNVKEGDCTISLGTSGTVFISRDKFIADAGAQLHSFCHANGRYHLMGCILSAAACYGWWTGVLQSDDNAREQAGGERYMGVNNVYFLPYLMGERSPHNDVHAKGAFIGLRPDTTRTQMTVAVLEGVAFALRDCIEVARRGGTEIKSARLCGGGAASPLWRKIIADVCGIPVEMPAVEQGPAYGAAMLAMVAGGAYKDVFEATEKIVRVKETILPDAETAKKYDERYTVFTKLYPALKSVESLF